MSTSKQAGKVRYIAEIGSNFNDDNDLAVKYINRAAEIGADVAKFQTLTKWTLLSSKILEDGKVVKSPIFDRTKYCDLTVEQHRIFKEASDKAGIQFASTPFYLEAVELLEEMEVPFYKVASGDITWEPLLKKVGETGKEVILSTGASDLKDVENALKILKDAGAGEITLLHCVSNYPPAWEEMNLRAITSLQEEFGCPVGISDHSPEDMAALAAIALGATVIEKHVTMDRSLPGPDHPFAMTFEEFGDMVRKGRLLELAMGDGEKEPKGLETVRQMRIRRGLYDAETHEPIVEPGKEGIWLRPQHGAHYHGV